MLDRLSLGINPVPAARPRVSKWGTYYPKNYSQFKKAARTSVKNSWGDEPLEGPLIVGATFYVERPKTTKLSFPKPDIDNYLKALFDACNELVWRDDCQIVSCHGAKQWADPGEPGRIVMTVQALE